MKDTFGRRINKGDIILYCTRRGSSQSMQLAVVDEDLFDNQIKAHTVAGNTWEWRMGDWNPQDGHVLYTGRSVTLTQPRNVVIVNGIDIDDIKARVEKEQFRAA